MEFEPIANQSAPEDTEVMRVSYTHSPERWAQIAKLGRAARWAKLSPRERSAVARHLASMRWAKYRAKKAAALI